MLGLAKRISGATMVLLESGREVAGMKTASAASRRYIHFAKAVAHVPRAPEVLKFICVPERTIYINLDALPGANLVEIYF